MPQLTPFYYMNEVVFSFTIIVLVLYVLSKYILPLLTISQVIRLYILKLNPQIR